MATLLKVLNNLADIKSAGGVALRVRTQDPLHVADVERVLGAAIARTFALELAMGPFLALGLLQRGQLAIGQHQAFLRHFGFERLEPLLHRLQIVTLSDLTNAGRRD